MNQNYDMNKLIFIEASRTSNLEKTQNNTNGQKRRRRRTGVFISNQMKDAFVQKQIVKDFSDLAF